MKAMLKQEVISVFVLLTLIYNTRGHPQCLDYKPPFGIESQQLRLCPEYADFGCCSIERDYELWLKHTAIMSSLQREERDTCGDSIRQVLCLECNPFAAHLFDAEATLVKRPLPGMCTSFCNDFYDTCSSTIQYLTDDVDTLISAESKLVFCEHNAIPDVDYCYPDLLTNPVLQYNISLVGNTVEGCICLEPLASNLRNPILLKSAPDESGRIFVGEQLGEVHIYYPNKTRLPEPFLNLTKMLLWSSYRGDERGFLGMAFHPQFAENGRLFVYYSTTINRQHHSRLSELRVDSNNPHHANHSSERPLLELKQPKNNHNGGELLFGLDGFLYLFLGDGGGAGDTDGYAQNLDSLLGKVLRLDVDSPPVAGSAYTVPLDNPFINEANAKPEIYAYGVRNIWRCDVDEGDPETGHGRGRIICGDVGQDRFEEIDIIERGGNYGWNAREGFECFKSDLCGNIGPEVLPIHAYPHSEGKSVTGGHVYRGCQNPAMQGKYIFGDFMNGRLFTLEEDVTAGTWSSSPLATCGSDVCFNGLTGNYQKFILSFGEDADGEVYILSTSYPSGTSATGVVYRIVDPRLRGDPSKCRTYKAPVLPTPTDATTEGKTESVADDVATTTDDHNTPTTKTTKSVPHANSHGMSFRGFKIATCLFLPVMHCFSYRV